MSSCLRLEAIPLRIPYNATLKAFNHDISILAYTYYSPTRKVYYVVIETSNPIRLCFRKKLTCLKWIFVDNRSILLTSFESGYIGCFDINGRLLFKQQIDSNPILNIYLQPSYRNASSPPTLLCLQSNGIILITSYDIYNTLKYSNFDISLLSQDDKNEYFAQIENDKKKQINKLKHQQSHLKYSNKYTYHPSPKPPKLLNTQSLPNSPRVSGSNSNINSNYKSISMLPSSFKQYEQIKIEQDNDHNIYIDRLSTSSLLENQLSFQKNKKKIKNMTVNVNDNNHVDGISTPAGTASPVAPIIPQIGLTSSKSFDTYKDNYKNKKKKIKKKKKNENEIE